MYGVKYIDLVSPVRLTLRRQGASHLRLLDLSRAHYAVYGVKYIDLVSPARLTLRRQGDEREWRPAQLPGTANHHFIPSLHFEKGFGAQGILGQYI